MGSSSSKFRKALQKGEEVEAMELYLKNPEIKRNLDPNYNYGENYNNNTLLHYACLYAMKPFIRDFTAEGANDSLKNSFNQTPIHFICMLDRGLDPVKDKQRAECLSLMLYRCRNGDETTADLGAKDHKGNTALHYASRSGLFHCVQLLVANDIPLYEENKDGQTACDCAIQGNFSDIASFLESKMVFSESAPEQEITDLTHPHQDDTESHRGLCAQDLQEAKDQLLVETADMLQVPLFTADALLRDHEWSREKLVVSWIADPKLACEKAGVRYPEDGDTENANNAPGSEATNRSQQTCIICTESIDFGNNEIVSLSCGHEVCSTCWESYLNIKIKEGDVHNIQCPAFSCKTLVPLETIEGIVSKEMARSYLQKDIKAFVESNPNIKWCPAKGCGRAVRLPLITSPSNAVSSLTQRRFADTPCQVVDCGSGHYFCWHCMQEPHKPCTCELWERWSLKIAEMLPQIPALNEKDALDECPETEKVANTLWLVTNSKHCPNCKSPIQKTEGCNHMKCTKCKYEFCWVCLELWKKHSSATGGYFRCNRYEIIRKLNIDCVDKIRQATEENMQIQKLNYFLHYYSRFKNHENSFKLEEPLLGAAKEKMTALAISAVENDASLDGVDTKFVEEAVRELLEARRVLKSSYVYGFFLDGNKEKKTIFELMQTEVEEATESLSQMVARPYLHTPRSKIIQATIFLRNKKQTFLLALSRGLIPDEELPKPFMSKLELLTNPQMSSEDESDEGEDNYSEIRRVIECSIRQQLTGIDTGSPENRPNSRMNNYLEMMCSRSGCPNPRINSDYAGPGQLSYYCCYDCLRIDMRNKRRRRKKRELKEEKMKQAEKMALTQKELENQEEMDLDLMRAIQLSLDCNITRRRDEVLPPSHPSSSSSSSGSIDDEHATGSPHDVLGDETSLQKALELSYGCFVKEKPPNQEDDITRAIQMSLEANSLTSPHTEHHDEYSSV